MSVSGQWQEAREAGEGKARKWHQGPRTALIPEALQHLTPPGTQCTAVLVGGVREEKQRQSCSPESPQTFSLDVVPAQLPLNRSAKKHRC